MAMQNQSQKINNSSFSQLNQPQLSNFSYMAVPKSLPLPSETFKHIVLSTKTIKSEMSEKVSRKDHELASAITNRSVEELPQFVVEASRLSILSHEELEALAVCEVNVPELEGRCTPNDHRMGTLEECRLCSTCKQTNIDCPGHLGIIRLNRWYLHVKFSETAIRILMCICNSCGECLLTEMVMKYQGLLELPLLVRIKKMSEICAKQRCTKRHYDAEGKYYPCVPNPTYFPQKAKDGYIVMCEYENPELKGNKIAIEKSIEEIYDIFCRIPAESSKLLGFDGKTKPKDFIMRSLAVPPPCARVYVIREGEISHDYLTTCYADIARYNNIVGQKMIEEGEDVEVQKKNAVRNLYFYISHLIDNSDGRYTRSLDEPIQSICERLTPKGGYIRGASMGKRVDFSGRSVLGPHNSIKFDQVVCPYIMKFIHTTPVYVCDFNLEAIIKMYELKEITYITFGSGELKGRRFKIMDTTRVKYLPKVKDLVERIGMDGDEILFNRQPTLHKQSIMGHSAIYSPDENYKCIGLPSPVNTPYNADYDGDEGNIHKNQTTDARVEARHIANVKNCIMNSQSNKPSMGLVYNSTTSAFLMTGGNGKDMLITNQMWTEVVKMLQDRSHLPSFLQRLAKWNISPDSGLALFSVICPSDLYYNSGNVKIRDGILISGPITKKQIGVVAGSMVHNIYKYYGKMRTSRFFTEAQWLLDWYIEKRGFSVGLKNCMCDDQKTQILIKDIIDSEIESTQMKIEGLGNPRPNASSVELDSREKQIQGFVNTIVRIGNRISSEALDKANSLNVMSRSGSKGTEQNIAQIIACLGQQYITGCRPSMSMTNKSRCLPYYAPHSTDIEAHGFIKESFMTGIKPSGMVFHMMASRIGIMDTALKTADTGHMHHRINKTLEDFVYDYNGSVRNMCGTIFQFAYSDGFNAGELIPTHSEALGNIINFVDLKSVIGKINLDAGYDYY